MSSCYLFLRRLPYKNQKFPLHDGILQNYSFSFTGFHVFFCLNQVSHSTLVPVIPSYLPAVHQAVQVTSIMGCRFSCCLPRGDYINRAYRAECFGTALHKQASATCQTKTYRMYVTASHSNKMHSNTNTQVLPHIPWECS